MTKPFKSKHQKIIECRKLMTEFSELSYEFEDIDDEYKWQRHPLMASMKRKSMDLTKALADFRKTDV